MSDQSLAEFRQQLDVIDQDLIKLLGKRMTVIKQVGEYKKSQQLAALDEQRWQQVIATRAELAQQYEVNPELVRELWELIHQESLRLEK
jgi:chorismate mutase